MSNWLDAADRLAERIVDGEVVFFIGAGYSLDSERNSAGVLIGRLLARFDAICTYLAEGNLRFRHQLERKAHKRREEEYAERVTDLRKGLETTFWLLAGHPSAGLAKSLELARTHEFYFVDSNVAELTHKYYELNDWMCNAFSILMGMIECLADTDRLVDFVRHHEDGRYETFIKEAEGNRDSAQRDRETAEKALQKKRNTSPESDDDKGTAGFGCCQMEAR